MLGEVQRDWSLIGRSVVRIFLALDKVSSKRWWKGVNCFTDMNLS